MKLTNVLPVLTVLLATGAQMQAQHATTLDALRDQRRVLLVFAGENDVRVEQQWSTLVDQRDHVAERDIVTVRITQPRVPMHDGNSPPEAVFSSAEEQRMRKRFHVSPDQFTVILVGKDGGEKLRSRQPIPWQTLADIIDAMPMRQSEMRRSR